MGTTDLSTAAAETAIDAETIERTATAAEVGVAALANELVVLHAELLSHHGEFERATEYVTVDGTRAYRVAESAWDDLAATANLDPDLRPAVEAAHTEQARLLFARSVAGDDVFDADEAGVVVGIDTAEQF